MYIDDFEEHLTKVHGVDSEKATERANREWLRAQMAKVRRGRQRMWDWTLHSFPADDVAGRRALKAARTWLFLEGDDPPDEYQTQQVYIHGPVGTGKTSLAYSMIEPWAKNWMEVGNGWPTIE
jgi:predicted ATPase